MKYRLIIIFGFFLFGCSQNKEAKKESLKDYYFPYTDFVEKIVYQFENTKDINDKSTWIMQIKIENNDTLLISEIQDSKKRPNEYLVEKIDTSYSRMIKYTLYDYDNNGNQSSTECKIITSNIFKWKQKLNESINWKVNYPDLETTNTNEFSKTRKLVRIDSKEKIAIFNDQFHFSEIGTDISFDWSMESHYKKGKGLVYYIIRYPDDSIKEFKLLNIKI